MDLFILDIPDGDQKEFQIALVDEPAIESDWIAFNKHQNFKIQSKERRIVSGYAMIADLEIPRYDERRGYYNVTFRKGNIEKIWLNFHRNNLMTNTNEMHQSGKFAEGVFVCESFIIDSERGIKAPEGFKQEPDGSWFISMKVENDDVWNKVLEGTFKGFSIEGRFFERPADTFASKLKDLININMTKEELKDKVVSFFNKEEDAKIEEPKKEGFESVMLVDGETELTIEPAVEVGAAVVIMLDGEPQPAPVGEHELEDGRVIVIEEAGIIAAINEPEVVVEEEPMADKSTPEQAQVKKIIERIESEKIFEKIAQLEETVKFLKEENEALKAEFTENKNESKDEFNKLKDFSEEVFKTLLDEPSKEPVKKQFNPFKKEKKGNIFLQNN
jgi:hypothetical protein